MRGFKESGISGGGVEWMRVLRGFIIGYRDFKWRGIHGMWDLYVEGEGRGDFKNQGFQVDVFVWIKRG